MARFEFYESPAEEQARLDRLADLRWRESANRMMLAAYRLHALLRKANFNPNQPRVPSGSTDGGQWTDGGGGSGGDWTRVAENVKPGVLSDVGAGGGRVGVRRNVAVSADPLRGRTGNNPAAQVSSALNAIASGRSTSFATMVDTMSVVGNATVTITRQQNDQIVMGLSTKLTSLRATGTLSTEAGKVTISNFSLTAPGFLNPLTIVSAPTQVTILDAADGTLRVQTDKRLTIKVPLEGNVIDYPAGQNIIRDR